MDESAGKVKQFCLLCNSFFDAALFEEHLTMKMHLYATSAEDLEGFKESEHLIPLLSGYVFCRHCGFCIEKVGCDLYGHKHKQADLEPSIRRLLECREEFTNDSWLIVRKVNYYGQMQVVCLVCSKLFDDFESHVTSACHVKGVQSFEQLNNVLVFYNNLLIDGIDLVERFIPLPGKMVQCIDCSLTLAYKNLAKLHRHCSYNSLLVDSSCSKLHLTKLLKFFDDLDYPDEILKARYPKNDIKLTYKFDKTPIYVAQRVGRYSIRCLMCCIEVSSAVEEIVRHFSSLLHLRTSNSVKHRQALASYHEYFMRENLPWQLKHHLFEPLNQHQAKCSRCKRPAAYMQALRHACDAPNETQPITMANSGFQLREAIVQELYPDHLDNYTSSSLCEIMACSSDRKVCLTCNAVVSGPVTDHLASPHHRKAFKANAPVVEAFHRYWAQRDFQEQLLQKYFIPLSKKKLICLQCLERVAMDQSLDHASTCALVKGKNNNVNTSEKEDASMYSNLVLEKLYPLLTAQPTDLLEECALQWRHDQFYCLYCRCPVKGSPELHVQSEHHRQTAKNNRTKLKSYHMHWTAMKNAASQLKQVKFNPMDNEHLSCVECHEAVALQDVHGHECCSYHRDVLKTIYLGNRKCELQKIRDKLFCLYCDTEVGGSAKIHTEGRSHRSRLNDPVRVKSVKAYHSFWSGKSRENQLKQVSYKPSTLTKMICFECRKPVQFESVMLHQCGSSKGSRQSVSKTKPKACRISYAGEVFNTIYLGDAKFELQLTGGDKFFCLYCNCEVQGSLELHTNGKKHKRMLNDQACVEIVMAYHSFWSNESPENQLKQVYYEPSTSTDMTCLDCRKSVRYIAPLEHKCRAKNAQSSKAAEGLEPPIIVRKECCVAYSPEVVHTIYMGNVECAVQMLGGKGHCLYCNDQVVGPLEVHTRSKSHRKKLKSPAYVQLVEAYHRFWSGQSAEDQLKQVSYRPWSLCQMFCWFCQRAVDIEHVLRRHKCRYERHDEEAANQCAIGSEMYPPMVGNDGELPQIQKRWFGLYHCLPCDAEFTAEFREAHLSSTAHRKSCGHPRIAEALRSFHDYWTAQPPFLKIKQVNFDLCEIGKMRCSSCREKLPFASVLRHRCVQSCQTGSEDHWLSKTDPKVRAAKATYSKLWKSQKNAGSLRRKFMPTHLERVFSVGCDEFSLPTVIKHGCYKEYCSEVVDTLYRHVKTGCVFGDFVAQEKACKVYYCLYCRRLVIGGDAKEHFSGAEHSAKLLEREAGVAVRTYHRYWLDESPERQMEQIHYGPLSDEAMVCLTCDMPLALKALKTHKHAGFYCDKVMRALYPHWIPAEKILTVQVRSRDLCYCLRCKEQFKSSSTEEHCSGGEHEARRSIPEVAEALKSFHDYWLAQHPEAQCRQIDFAPSDSQSLFCCKCEESIRLEAIPSHRCRPNQVDVQSTSKKLDLSRTTFIHNRKPLRCVSCKEAVDFESVASHACIRVEGGSGSMDDDDIGICCIGFLGGDLQQHRSSEEHLAMRKPYVEAFDEFWERQGAKNLARRAEFVPYGLDVVCCVKCHEPVPYHTVLRHECDKEYCDMVVSKLYPHVKSTCVYGDFIAQMKEEKIFYCLFCRTHIHGDMKALKVHYRGQKHTKRRHDEVSPGAFRSYHEYWLDESPVRQLEQIHYGPWNDHTMICLTCNITLSMNSIGSHKHEGFYCPEVMWKLYPHWVPSHKKLFVIQCRSEGVRYCLRCNALLTNCRDDHCSGKRHRALAEQLVNTTEALEAYHAYWLAQSPESQWGQTGFGPDDSQHMVCCQCGESILFEDVPQHQCRPDVAFEYQQCYGEEVMNAIYPHVRGQDKYKCLIQNVNQQDHKRCLCCGLVFRGDVQQHLESKWHKSNALEESATFRAYHRFWSSLGAVEQKRQLGFFPYDSSDALCVRCRQGVPYEDALTHECPDDGNINALPHDFLYANAEASRTLQVGATSAPVAGPVHKFWFIESCHDQVKNVICLNCHRPCPSQESLLQEHQCLNTEQTVVVSATFDELPALLEKLTIHDQPRIIRSNGTESPAAVGASGPVNKGKSTDEFEPIVLDMIYPPQLVNVAKDVLQVDFPLARLLKGQLSCLLCREQLNNTATSLESHLRDKHRESEKQLQRNLESVEAFHGYFEKQPPDMQCLQTKFLPGGSKSAVCNRGHVVALADIMNHKCNGNDGKGKPGGYKRGHHEMVAVGQEALPGRLQHQAKYFCLNPGSYRCKHCKVNLEDFAAVMQHMVAGKHATLVQRRQPCAYLCDVCLFRTRKEGAWQKHFASASHLKMFEGLGPVRRTSLSEYECKLCFFVLYGDMLSVFEHEVGLMGVMAQKFNSNREATDVQLRHVIGCADYTDAKVLQLREQCAPSDSYAVKECLAAIQETLRANYPTCQVYPFGSRVTGVATSDSDLDVYADVADCYHGGAYAFQNTIIKDATKIFKRQKQQFRALFSIPSARTPIIRFVHSATGIHCDLSFVNGLSVENTKYTQFCFDLQPIAKDAALLLRWFCDVELIKSEMDITSYATSMLLVFFLQLHGYLLPVHKLRELTATRTTVIDDWPTVTYNQPIEELRKHVTPYQHSVHHLMMGFFDFYAEYDFGSEVVCPLLGRSVLRSNFSSDGANLPQEMSFYALSKKEDFREDDCHMCVQDPFDLSHNITKGVRKDALEGFQFKCRNALQQFHQNTLPDFR